MVLIKYLKRILRFTIIILVAPFLLLIWGIYDFFQWVFEKEHDWLLKDCIIDLLRVAMYGL